MEHVACCQNRVSLLVGLFQSNCVALEKEDEWGLGLLYTSELIIEERSGEEAIIYADVVVMGPSEGITTSIDDSFTSKRRARLEGQVDVGGLCARCYAVLLMELFEAGYSHRYSLPLCYISDDVYKVILIGEFCFILFFAAGASFYCWLIVCKLLAGPDDATTSAYIRLSSSH
ncbi:hypothetical protein Tco_0636013 [Tanacetum coccineum]